MEYESWRGDPEVTKKAEFIGILKLVNANSKDIFCDLGCGHGRLCIWASRIVKFSFGVEDRRKRHLVALKNVKKSGRKNVKILREDYTDVKTLSKLKQCNIFYCTNEEGWAFYKKFEETMRRGTYIISPYLPSYPIKPEFHKGWMYVMKTPFTLAKNKKEWINSLSDKKNVSMKDIQRKIYREFSDYKQRLKDLDDNISGTEWLIEKRQR